MKIRISFRKFSETELSGYSSDLIYEKFLPVKLGIVEECQQLFKITEINDNSIKVAYRDGEHASIGTFSTATEAEWNADYSDEKVLAVDEGVTVSRSLTYNGSERGEMYSLQLIND